MTGVTLANLNEDILVLICDAIDDGDGLYDSQFARPSLKALSATCRSLRAAAAPALFETLAIWIWDSLVETARAMMQCELARRHTRALRVTPVLVRPEVDQDAYSILDMRNDDFYLPMAMSDMRNNVKLHYNRQGTPRPSIAYKPLARIEGGSQASVIAEAEALRDLLLKFENLTTLIFGLGTDAALHQPFEHEIVQAFGRTHLPTVRALNIEDTALFWTGICDQADDVTVYLGYRRGTPEWPSAPAVRNLTLHHTVVCRSVGEPFERIYLPARLPINGENFNCGPAITKAMPSLASLDLFDCGRHFKAILPSLAGFRLLKNLRVRCEISSLDIGLVMPESFMMCGGIEVSDEEEEPTPEEIEAAERREVEFLNEDRRRAMNSAKRIVLTHFPQLQHVQLGEKVCYDFSSLSEERTMEEVELLQPSPPVEMHDVC